MTVFARIGRDLCLIGAGIFLLASTPPSLRESGLSGALGLIWALMIGGGAIASLLGVTFKAVKSEIYGCVFVGAGFLVWAVAAVARPDATATSWALSCVFLSGTFGQLYRVAMITDGRVLR